MNEYNYKKDNSSLKQESLMNALDEMYKENMKNNEKIFDENKDDLNKTYDPYTPLELITPLIDKADKYANVYAFSLSSMFLIFAIFLGSITFIVHNEKLMFLSIILLLISFTALTFLLAFTLHSIAETQEKLSNLRMKYFDKNLIEKLLEKRKKKDSIVSMFAFMSIFMGFLFTFYSIIMYGTEFLFIPLFLSLSFGLFIFLRTSTRKKTLEKLINTIQK